MYNNKSPIILISTIFTRCVSMSVVLKAIHDMNFIQFTQSFSFSIVLRSPPPFHHHHSQVLLLFCVWYFCLYIRFLYTFHVIYILTNICTHNIRFDSILFIGCVFHIHITHFNIPPIFTMPNLCNGQRNVNTNAICLFKQTNSKTNNFGSTTKNHPRLLI